MDTGEAAHLDLRCLTIQPFSFLPLQGLSWGGGGLAKWGPNF